MCACRSVTDTVEMWPFEVFKNMNSNALLNPWIFISCQKTHQSALQVQQKAEAMLQANHYDMDMIRECAEKVASHWQQLMLKMEDRLKLVNASVAFYKTSEQVQKCYVSCVSLGKFFSAVSKKISWLYLIMFTNLITMKCSHKIQKIQKANYFPSCLSNRNHGFNWVVDKLL